MPTLVIEHSGKRQSFALSARALIGRAPDCDVVIDHPAVSRKHAIIEPDADGFVLTDAGSHNGTFLDDHQLTDRQALCDRNVIRIGPASIRFLQSADAVEESIESPQETPAGITRRCGCGSTLWIPREMLGQLAKCRRCGRVNTLSEKITCGVCQWEITDGAAMVACPSCGLTFHSDCWTQNRGCSAYGCDQVSVLDPIKPDIAAPVAAEEPTDAPPRQPWEWVLLCGAIVGSLVGAVAFGVPALLAAIAAALYLVRTRSPHVRTGIVTAAIIVALIGTAGGVFVSRMFWLSAGV
jgi:hypothetical protein